MRRTAHACTLALAAVSCTGEILPDSAALQGHEVFGPGPVQDASSADKNDAGMPTPIAASCPTTPVAAPAPLSRLTNREYRNTLGSLFPGLTIPDVTLPDDIVVEGFDNNAKAQTPSPALIEQYQTAAQTVASAVTNNLGTALPCQPSSSAQEDTCGVQFIEQFVTHAYRHPITADETSRYNTLFSAAKSAYGFQTAIGMVVQAALQTPQFLYRVELGGPAQNGIAPLTGYELASRLSYFLWDTAPDETLLTAAGAGTLDNATGVEQQARRLLAEPRAHVAVANLFRQWLRFDKMDRMPKNADSFPSWNEQVAASLRSSTSQFVEHEFWDDGSLRSLLTDDVAYVDANIAPLYGVAASGSALQLVGLNSAQRSGILTQAGLLAAFAHETADSPVLRGVFVMDRLLCTAPPPPPPGVTGSIMETTATATTMTTRDRVAMTHEQNECASCHHTIDGFGFGFSHYDAVGKWRETDNGLPVNAKGWIASTRDADGEFDGAVELGQRLADSAQVHDCVASQWFRYSLGLGAADVDKCALAPVATAFSANDGDMNELIIATVTSAAFRNRPEVKP